MMVSPLYTLHTEMYTHILLLFKMKLEIYRRIQFLSYLLTIEVPNAGNPPLNSTQKFAGAEPLAILISWIFVCQSLGIYPHDLDIAFSEARHTLTVLKARKQTQLGSRCWFRKSAGRKRSSISSRSGWMS